MRRASSTFERAEKLLGPEIAAYKAVDSRWDSAVAAVLGRQPVSVWLERVKADRDLRAGVRGLRGFFLADPEDLSLLPLVDQFASGATPGTGRMYRLREGNDALPQAMAGSLRGRVLLNAVVRAVVQGRRSVRVTVDAERRSELSADFVVLAVPASIVKEIHFAPALTAAQQRANASLHYGPATRVVLQFESRFWKGSRRPSAYGTDRPTGAVWDANEQQGARPGILTLLAGGQASGELQSILDTGGGTALVRRLTWLGRPSRLLAARSRVWEKDRWVKGGYAVFDPAFDPSLRTWLSRPAGRAVFAGEHTSERWQGYMNGAVESGRRAAVEVAMMAGLDYARVVL